MAADVSGDGKSAVTRRVNKVDEAEMRVLGLGTGWTVFSYMISGLVAYGAIGWGIGKLIHAEWPFPAGMIVGLAISVGYVIYRYGRQGSVEQARDGHGRVKGNDR
jgi:ATP synthase protein I